MTSGQPVSTAIAGLPLFERGNTLKPEFRSIYGETNLATGEFFPGRTEGLQRRDEGIGEVDLAEGEIWKSKADAAIILLASGGDTFTADDVRQLAGNPHHPNAMGSCLLKASKAGRIVCVGIDQSRRAEGHARGMRVWRAT